MRLMVEFKSFALSEYLVGTWLVDLDRHRSIESTMSVRRLLWTEWKGKVGFQLLSLMLKLPAIIKILWIFASVSLRYFKADWEESE